MNAINNVIEWLKTFFVIHQRLAGLNQKTTDAIESQVKLIKILISLVSKMPEHQTEFAHQLLELYEGYIEKALEREKQFLNPLTADEVGRLENYYAMYKNSLQLTVEQATDFKELAQRLEEDRKQKNTEDVIGAAALFGIAFLVLTILSKKK